MEYGNWVITIRRETPNGVIHVFDTYIRASNIWEVFKALNEKQEDREKEGEIIRILDPNYSN